MGQKVKGRLTITTLNQFERILSERKKKDILTAIDEMMKSKEIYAKDSDIRDEIRELYNVSIYTGLLKALKNIIKINYKKDERIEVKNERYNGVQEE